jgi:ribosome-associated toxin RatA of RatAB toxin-antitoxin module
MNASPDAVFAQVNDLKNWNSWSPWAKKDPETKWVFSETTAGKDAWYTWESDHDNVGSGKLVITESIENQSVKTDIDFGEQGTGKGSWKFEKTDGGTKVTWGMDSDMGNNPIGKIFGLMMDSMLGPDFEEGLQSMKELVEG